MKPIALAFLLLAPSLVLAQAGPGPTPTTITAGAGITLTPNPLTGRGTVALSGTPVPSTAAANLVLSGPASGSAATPAFRALVLADLPAQTGTGLLVLGTSPTLVTPTLGAAAGTSLTLPGTAAALKVGVSSDTVTPTVVSTNTATALPVNTGGSLARFVAADGVTGLVSADGSGANASLQLRRWDTTAASPTAVQTAETLGVLNFQGYTGTNFQTGAQIQAVTAQAFASPSQRGTSLNFFISPLSLNVQTTVLSLDATTLAVDLGGTEGRESLHAPQVASAVNWVTISGAVTGGQPSIVSAGAGTEQGLTIGVRGGTLNLTPVSIAMPNISTSGTPVAYACFTSTGQLISSVAPC